MPRPATRASPSVHPSTRPDGRCSHAGLLLPFPPVPFLPDKAATDIPSMVGIVLCALFLLLLLLLLLPLPYLSPPPSDRPLCPPTTPPFADRELTCAPLLPAVSHEPESPCAQPYGRSLEHDAAVSTRCGRPCASPRLRSAPDRVLECHCQRLPRRPPAVMDDFCRCAKPESSSGAPSPVRPIVSPQAAVRRCARARLIRSPPRAPEHNPLTPCSLPTDRDTPSSPRPPPATSRALPCRALSIAPTPRQPRCPTPRVRRRRGPPRRLLRPPRRTLVSSPT